MPYIYTVSKQVLELKEMLELNKQEIRNRCSILETATQSLSSLSRSIKTSPQALYQFPGIMQTVLANDSIGALILGPDTKVVLFNGVAQRIFGDSLWLDERQKFSCKLYLDDMVTLCPTPKLPWVKALSGIEAQGEKFFFRRSKEQNGAWLHIDAIPLLGENQEAVGGTVVLVLDITEPLKVRDRVEIILNTLSQHIMAIECAQAELNKLAERLGANGWNTLAQPIPISEKDINVIVPAQTKPVLQQADTNENNELLSDARELVDALNRPETITPPEKVLTLESPKEESAATNIQEEIFNAEPEQIVVEIKKDKILIVDDLIVNQKLLQLELESQGFEVDTAFNGQEAVEKVANNDYLMIFMDCDMPVMNGYEATSIIRKTEHHTGKHVPIVALTAYDRNGDRERCQAIGMDHYLTKGTSSQEIINVIELCRNHELGTGKQSEILEASNTSESALPLGDVDRLYKSYGAEQSHEIIAMFLATSSDIIKLLGTEIEQHNSGAVNHLSYSLKGPCATLGMQRLVRLTVDIASYAALGRWIQVKEMFAQLKSALVQLEEQNKLDHPTMNDANTSAPVAKAEALPAKTETPKIAEVTVTENKPAEPHATGKKAAEVKEKEVIIEPKVAKAKSTESPKAEQIKNSALPNDEVQRQVFEKLDSISKRLGREAGLKLIEAYRQDISGAEQQVKEAILHRDAEALRSISHLLTGCSRTVGASEAIRLCNNMQEIAQAMNWQEAVENYVPMFTAIRAISSSLDLYKAREEKCVVS